MNVFYEEDGGFKVGAVMSSTDASLQVEAPHGKRSKIKTAHVLLKFTSPLADFLPQAETAAADIDVDFLWECCGADEFQFEALAADYWGHAGAGRWRRPRWPTAHGPAPAWRADVFLPQGPWPL